MTHSTAMLRKFNAVLCQISLKDDLSDSVNSTWKEKLIITKKTLHEMKQQFANTPVSNQEYCIDNKKYLIISHYAGEKDIDKVLNEIAVNKAYSDLGKTPA